MHGRLESRQLRTVPSAIIVDPWTLSDGASSALELEMDRCSVRQVSNLSCERREEAEAIS
jgi:hypothetical protein